MSLPRRQQMILDQIEQALQAADPRLKSMFAAFHRSSSAQAAPDSEVIAGRAGRTVMICVAILSVLGALLLGIRTAANACPGLPSDQVVASAAVRFAACDKGTDVWSKGAR
jgi:hypothetical protein